MTEHDEETAFAAAVLNEARSNCKEVIEEWQGQKCEECLKVITGDDVQLILDNRWLVLRSHEDQAEHPRCYECYEELHHQLKRFSGDNCDLHPDETVDLFNDHED